MGAANLLGEGGLADSDRMDRTMADHQAIAEAIAAQDLRPPRSPVTWRIAARTLADRGQDARLSDTKGPLCPPDSPHRTATDLIEPN